MQITVVFFTGDTSKNNKNEKNNEKDNDHHNDTKEKKDSLRTSFQLKNLRIICQPPCLDCLRTGVFMILTRKGYTQFVSVHVCFRHIEP